MIQGTHEWLEWRRKGVGGSEVGVLMGESDFSTPLEIFRIKRGLATEKVTNFAMERGIETEPKIRALYELWAGIDVPSACVEHAEHSYLRMSLDGWAKGNRIAEFKYPGAEKHEMAKNGIVPPCYVAQIQYGLAITGEKVCDYVSYNGEEIAVVSVLPDPVYQERMLATVKAFWENVINDVAPELTDQDYLDLVEPDAVSCFETFKAKRAAQDKLGTAAAKARAIKLITHPRVRCAGVRVVKRSDGAYIFTVEVA